MPHYKNSVLFGTGILVRFFSHSAVLSSPKTAQGRYTHAHPVRVGVRGSEYLAYDRDSGSELYPEVPENKNKC